MLVPAKQRMGFTTPVLFFAYETLNWLTRAPWFLPCRGLLVSERDQRTVRIEYPNPVTELGFIVGVVCGAPYRLRTYSASLEKVEAEQQALFERLTSPY